ncbi:MAG TPA: NAD(P)-binding domain-containing protein [Terriglobales bacterium]|nr:NAD(P)-binding domain-containing protein [Terriglobales bacterium]
MTTARRNAVVFLGGGRITGALLAGLRLAGYRKPIVVHDRHPRKLRQLRARYDVKVEPDLQRAIAQAHLLIIAVRPDSVRALLQEIKEARPTLAVSLAAGIPLKNLRAWMGRPVHWGRAMPSPVARAGRGLTAITFDRAFPAAARREIRRFFALVGPVYEIPESKFDAFTVTYSSSHGYHALDALAGAAVKLGLDRRTALTAAAHALADGILAWRESGISLQALLHEAATPGGIAAATQAGMDKSGYRRVVEQGLRAGIGRAKRNARRPAGR